MLAVKVNYSKVVMVLLNESANPFLKDQLCQEALNYKVTDLHTAKETYPIQQMLEASKK